jgi:outer membrane receptor protein involved in Fe transport
VRGVAIRVDSRNAVDFTGQAPGALAPVGFDSDGAVTLRRDNLSVNGSWRRKLGSDPDHEVVLDLTQEHNTDRTSTRSDLVSRGPGLASRAESQDIASDADQSHVKLDYTLPFDSGAKLKTGYELEYDRDAFDNFGLRGPTPDTQAPDPSFIDDFRFDQAVNGVYATWQQPFGKLTVLGGLRLEDTRIDMRDPTTGFRGENDDTRFYPSLHLSWKVDDSQELRASYSERIVRPQPSDYNPFRRYQDPFNFRAGNPGLKPQQTHSFELGYEYRKGFTYDLATLYWRENEKGVTDVVSNLGSGVLLTTRENLSESRNGGLELTAVGRLGAKLSYQLRGDIFWNEIDASDLGFGQTRSAWTASGGAVLNWQATPKDQFQLVANIVPKRLTPQGYHKPMVLTFAGYRHVFNKDWSLSVSARDLLGSYTDTFVIDTPALRDRSETHLKLRAIFLQVSYSFGAGPRKDTGIDYGATGVGAGGGTPR